MFQTVLPDQMSPFDSNLQEFRGQIFSFFQLREKREKQHASERKAASDKQLASVKQMHIDKLVSQLSFLFQMR